LSERRLGGTIRDKFAPYIGGHMALGSFFVVPKECWDRVLAGTLNGPWISIWVLHREGLHLNSHPEMEYETLPRIRKQCSVTKGA
jgi:hypothetical protein